MSSARTADGAAATKARDDPPIMFWSARRRPVTSFMLGDSARVDATRHEELSRRIQVVESLMVSMILGLWISARRLFSEANPLIFGPPLQGIVSLRSVNQQQKIAICQCCESDLFDRREILARSVTS